MSRRELLLVLVSLVHLASAFSAGSPPSPKTSRPYEVVGVNTSCTAEELRVRVALNRNFRGVVYAKGFPLEKNCRSLGSDETFVEISISTSGCGVRLVPVDEDTLSFSVSLNIQMDKFLQQINDIEISASCRLSPNDMVHTRHAILNKHVSRTGRYRVADPEAMRDEDNSVRSIRSWMEIEGTSGNGANSKVAVGEQTLVLVKSLLPDEMTANVVDCFAHDGTREVTQRLLDEDGCPLDESIMSSLETIRYEGEEEEGNEIAWEETTPSATVKPVTGKARRVKTEERGRRTNVQIVREGAAGSEEDVEEHVRMHVIGTMFSAFKFPDTSNLHLKCVLQICRRVCPQVTCDEEPNDPHNRTSKSMKSSDFSSVIDRIEVFNSVEVVAPGIDNDGYTSPDDLDELRSASGEKTFCLSASKMAFSFAILGAVFLCGVLAALWTIMRNQMRKMNKSYDGSEQTLVVRDSPLNLIHSRNKPFTNWSYT
ncbi:UNVERIFIED_CONTAM: hypothetical protein PYX00_010336 [Menopon gallinae]|uniref:ZP domain-containing protein n=1 Tax=Menopon gallinae TaxID=328185 RepID=A0AAW2HF95_9NEOP